MIRKHAFTRGRRMQCSAIAILVGVASSPAGAAAPNNEVFGPIDSSSPTSFFYTTYQLFGSDVSWSTCGYDAQSSGCFGGGSLGPFGHICSVAGSSSRIVIADSNPTNGGTTLSFYKQDESSTPSSTLQHTLQLPEIPASPTAKCQMATLGNFLYFGTNNSSTFYKVNTLTYVATPGSVCGGVTSAITASNNFVVVSMSGCFAGFDKLGNIVEDGGEFSDTFVPGANGFVPLQ